MVITKKKFEEIKEYLKDNNVTAIFFHPDFGCGCIWRSFTAKLAVLNMAKVEQLAVDKTNDREALRYLAMDDDSRRKADNNAKIEYLG